MKRFLSTILTLSMLLTLPFSSSLTFAQTIGSDVDETSELDDASPVPRVARLTLIQGDVSFLRAGVTEWAPAVENLPLLAGDQIYAERGARAEIQLARGNYVRLSESTALTITELSDTSAQLEITEGTAIIRIERLSAVFQRFEVDTPNSAVVLQKDGLYRIDVRGETNSELIVRRGEAEASTDEGAFRVREGHRLLVDTAAGGRLELAADTTRDDWDQWSFDRDNTIASTSVDRAPDYVTSYETTHNDFYGASDLSSYGTWTNYSSYGNCWIPRVSSDWAPYRSGQWLWIPAAGWTWLSSEPWGWAPYHYGRWAHLSGLGWAWIPGIGSPYRGYGYRDYRWRPALVYFFNCPTPRGNYVGWYPLAPGERWRRPDRSRGNDHAHLRYPSPRDGGRRPDDGRYGVRPPQQRHGVTILPADGFARGDRAAVRPVAPGRELSDWINKGARPGLPEVNPTPVAARPRLDESDRRSSRRVAIPSNEIIKRPVVTRNPKTDSTARVDAPRERRLILPRNPGVIKTPAMIEGDGADRRAGRRSKPPSAGSPNGSDSADQREQPKVRLRLPSPTEKLNDDGSTPARKRMREREEAADRPSQESDRNSGNSREEKRRARHEQSPPAPRESNPSEVKQPNNERRSREKSPPATDSGAPENPRSKVRFDEPARSRDRGEPAPRTEPRQEQPRSENRDQARQERQQEKQQRQEQPRTETRDQTRQERHEQKEQRQERQQQEQRKRP